MARFRFFVLVPIVLAIIAFICSMLCLFAGYNQGFLENYDILSLNTSRLGFDILKNKIPQGGIIPNDTVLPDFIDDWLNKGEDKITETANDVANIVADHVADELGIHEWYSLHVMDLCYGKYKPNATFYGASKNGTNCTRDVGMNNFDITSVIERELSQGPLKLNLTDLNWPDQIQEGLDALNTALDVSFILYLIGIGAAGLSILTSIISIFAQGRIFSFLNGGLAFLSFACLAVTSIIITIMQKKATDVINEHGNEIGVYAYVGRKFLILTWVSVAAMLLSFITWIPIFIKGKKDKMRRHDAEKAAVHDPRLSGDTARPYRRNWRFWQRRRV